MSVNSSKAANASGKRGSLGVGIKGKSGGLSFANLNVGVKVGAGFALILVFLLAVSIVSSMGLSGANGDGGFYAAKIKTARFFADQVLPQSRGLLRTITEGSGTVMALAEDQF